MARHLLHRFLLTLQALWLVLTLVFLLIHIVPGDPGEQLGEGTAPGQVEQLRHALGLGLPLVVCAAIAIPSGMLAAAAARRPTALSEG